MDPSRISLRPFRLSDAADFLKSASDERIAKTLRWEPITSREEAIAHLQNVAIPHPWHHSICLDDRSIGYIAVWQGSGDESFKGNMGYAVSADHWGHGIATIAMKMALARVSKDLPDLIRLEAGTWVDNKKSQRVLEKSGFIREGLFRKYFRCKGEIIDLIIFSFLSTDKICN